LLDAITFILRKFIDALSIYVPVMRKLLNDQIYGCEKLVKKILELEIKSLPKETNAK
jgi:hypothetical protein